MRGINWQTIFLILTFSDIFVVIHRKRETYGVKATRCYRHNPDKNAISVYQ